MTSIACDIVLLPAAKLAQKAITLSEQLKKFGTLFTLKDGEYFPHASLYMVQLKTADLPKVQEVLAAIAAATPAFNLTASGYDQAEGYIDADYTCTDTLAGLQMTVINGVNPLRDGLRQNDKARIATATGTVRQNLEQYGYRSVGELFRPHLTLTRFANEQSIEPSLLPDPSEFNGPFTKLGLFEMDNNGTCVRKIAEFDLAKREQ